ncbi:hypothetical protein QVA66_07065 [Staphylococcus chromogenes]|nr:hypothetical protein [Staphylococcus chromogenes]
MRLTSTAAAPIAQPPATPAPAVTPPTLPHAKVSPAPTSELAVSGGQVGMVLVDATGARSFGTLLSDVSWSTMKVPVALAALRKGTAQPGLLSAALQSSDNAAAQAMWDSLGAPNVAGRAVQAEIAQVAAAPQVQTQAVRPGFSAFGQTQWSLVDQATFGYRLPCHDLGAQVTELMGAVAPSQRYGLGTLSGAHFKGGWGPGPNGAYLVRQFGYVDTSTGRYGVAIAAIANDGTYESAQTLLTQLASHIPATTGTQGSPTCS